MFKYEKGVLPYIINLFAVNNKRHNYNTRHNHDLQINTGNGEIVYKLVSFHGVHIFLRAKLLVSCWSLQHYGCFYYKILGIF